MPERLRSFTTRRYINPRYLYLNLYAALRYMLIANVIKKNCNLSNEKATFGRLRWMSNCRPSVFEDVGESIQPYCLSFFAVHIVFIC